MLIRLSKVDNSALRFRRRKLNDAIAVRSRFPGYGHCQTSLHLVRTTGGGVCLSRMLDRLLDMALSVKNEEADRLAREITARTGETLTDAVLAALRERLHRLRCADSPTMVSRLDRLSAEASELPVLDPRPADDILGYDDDGLPT